MRVGHVRVPYSQNQLKKPFLPFHTPTSASFPVYCSCPLPHSPPLYNPPNRIQLPSHTTSHNTNMINFRPKRLTRSLSKLGHAAKSPPPQKKDCKNISNIKWELRPGGMLVQKRDAGDNTEDAVITLRVSNVSQWHDISVQPTSTFGEFQL